MLRTTLIVATLAASAAQRGSPFRCQDRDPQCATWAGRGECANNNGFMAEKCPQACEYCENAGLHPTPARFQLDLVCKERLAINPGTISGGAADDLPEGCTFRCRNNMTETMCAAAAAAGQCEDKTVSKTVRAQCPESCGVCKALEMAAPPGTPPYPKGACREDTESGNAAEHAESCASWAAAGECVKNFGFMSLSCEAACGLCEVGGAVPKTPAQINAPPPSPRKKTGKKKKKKKKAVLTQVGAYGETTGGGGGEDGGGEAADAAPAAAAAEEEKAAPAAAEKVTPAPAEKAAEQPAAEAEPAAAGSDGKKKKKKGWAQKAKDAMGAAFGKKGGKDEV